TFWHWWQRRWKGGSDSNEHAGLHNREQMTLFRKLRCHSGLSKRPTLGERLHVLEALLNPAVPYFFGQFSLLEPGHHHSVDQTSVRICGITRPSDRKIVSLEPDVH